ncbi:MAG: glutamine--tRNA ligase/YqeY domain fusion protein [Planctomycetes bacterium]|nr:glutamine--tRNA ligase/YqeY domain fusion protein [Planctomycetota bacterium]MBI3848408.1 glutamine--tRNA ligase/YqeY domain fusion protein [Planctomycetota bacterium]
MSKPQPPTPTNFIHDIVESDNASGKHGGRVATRFPPEPNGYLHIGHAKSICLNFGTAAKYGGTCNLRFDDTNPVTEDVEYVESIQADIHWLGFDWQDRLYFASDYFDRLHDFAVKLIQLGKAYVCHLSPDEIREYRGTLQKPGKESPYRNRSVAENLDLFRQMREGKLDENACVLRAKIDMNSPNVVMRDPVIYRIKKASHHRTGNKWCIYPMYDFAHCLSDSIERITHSICTLEFENNRPLYDWILDELKVESHPQQIEFARLNLSRTVMSKRKLMQLVNDKLVSGWDDPRMPTLAGLRRRGMTPAAIRTFCERIGVAKKRDTLVDVAVLEDCVREDLNRFALRIMAVLRPLRVVLTNYPEGQVDEFETENNPEDPAAGLRKLPFSKVLYIEEDDFREDPPADFFRLAPGREVRLKQAYFIKCNEVVKDASGKIVELRCTYDPETKGGDAKDGRKVKATLHWVSAAHAVETDVRLYDHLFTKENPGAEEEGVSFKDALNPESLTTLRLCRLESSVRAAKPGTHYQFLRHGYFFVDPVDSTPGKPVFNRVVTLRDTYAKAERARR